MSTRREFLRRFAEAGLGWRAAHLPFAASRAPSTPRPKRFDAWRRESALGAALRTGDPGALDVLASRPLAGKRFVQAAPEIAQRFPDLSRHFVFEYYPWYQADPWRHWDQWHRLPPGDMAANHVPRLGPYDSRSRAVLEQHARWIAESGAGAINLSWWGQGNDEDRLVPLVMDVMRDHGLKVAFHLEPYALDHGERWFDDVLYLLREYGEKRRYDALLLLRNQDGTPGPVFKGFRTILPKESTDCHGVTRPVGDYTPDEAYRSQLDALRDLLRRDFDHVTFLADSLDFSRAPRSGFDGIAIYDNFVPPSRYAEIAQRAGERGLVFSLNVNPGYDSIEPRVIEPDSCYRPLPFAPATAALDWSQAEERERAATLSLARITESWTETLSAQTDASLLNARSGFLLVYLNSFNEWHEGHAFEPMMDAAALSLEERRYAYHNPARGDYRLQFLKGLIRELLNASALRTEAAALASERPAEAGYS